MGKPSRLASAGIVRYLQTEMSTVTQLLHAARLGDPQAASQLLPIVYDALRDLARQLLAAEEPGQTLQPTALVHEAYLRLIGPSERVYADEGHFFAAAAQAMRHILVDNARRKQRDKHGGRRTRVPIDETAPAPPSEAEELLALDDALTSLARFDPDSAAVVQLRYFAGLSVEDAAASLGMSRATAYRHWTFARAWLHQHVTDSEPT
jgi:RNA polymerase sigma factor (TIGR02999 family)